MNEVVFCSVCGSKLSFSIVEDRNGVSFEKRITVELCKRCTAQSMPPQRLSVDGRKIVMKSPLYYIGKVLVYIGIGIAWFGFWIYRGREAANEWLEMAW